MEKRETNELGQIEMAEEKQKKTVKTALERELQFRLTMSEGQTHRLERTIQVMQEEINCLREEKQSLLEEMDFLRSVNFIQTTQADL